MPRLALCPFVLFLLALPGPAPAAGGDYRAFVIDAARSEVRFQLKAPKHDAEGRSKSIEGRVELPGPALTGARNARASLPAASLDAGNPLINHNMRGALEAGRYPEIVFEATRFEPDAEAPTGDGAWRGTVTGMLTVHGVSRRVSFDVTASPEGDALRAKGSATFKLTDFEIEPPRLLGFLRVKDWVRVEFDVVAAPGDAP
jgi:polyisoprenoid-binding protein YceI